MLFNKRLLQTHLNSFDFPVNYDFPRVNKIIGNWQKSIKDGNYDSTKETRVQASFLNLFFNIILGYTEMNDNPDEWYLINEAKTEVDSTRADGTLGFFTKNEKSNLTRAVIELKDAKTPLDKKQSTRKDYDSPVSQAFSYSSKFDRCDWIIVSNFKEIRLYNKDRGQGYYESFEVLDLHEEKEFKRFYFLLCKENLLDKERNSLLDRLVKDTSKNEDEISKQFYKDFKELRKELFKHICEHNPNTDKTCLLEKTQKLLDRFIFVFFCEDSANLLPVQITKKIYETAINSFDMSDQKVWNQFKGLFKSIDKGNNNIKPPINAYNGGLFAFDEILDNLTIKDAIWEKLVKLSDYDFESDLNVNILGHIFEQSLSDLEQLKADIDGIEQDKNKSKRKKDGIFYTPEYITRYIVEQTVGKYLEENPDKLETIKILDPACGSGAFINQAHSFLRQEYQIRHEEKLANAKENKTLNIFEHTNIAETDRSILLNNLYGVDLNEESTEITKLALWLKTAKQNQPLQNLDNNIKCGNSLINDVEFAGNKAFKWEEEFKDILGNGGFDIIIGNPPYGAELNSQEKDYYKNKYSNVIVRYLNTYNFFISKAFNLLKDGGFFAFIIPNTLLYQLEDMKTRKLLINNFSIHKIINLGDAVFTNAEVPTCIFVLQKVQTNKNEQYYYADLRKIKNNFVDKNFENYYKQQNISEIILNETLMFGIDNIAHKLIEKLNLNSIKINDIATDVSQGVITGKNSIYRLSNEFITLNNFENELFKPTLIGEEINRYTTKGTDFKLLYATKDIDINQFPNIYKHLSTFKEILSQKRETEQGKLTYWCLHRPRCEELFMGAKIILRQTGDKIIATLDNNNNFVLNNILCIKLKQNNDYKYILTLLNSKLFDYLYKNISQEEGRNFAEVKPINIRKLPIYKASKEQQESLADKAEKMIELNKILHEQTQSALNLIKSEYTPKKMSQKLEKFYTLGINPFMEELKKQGVKLSLSQKQELLEWYASTSKKLNALQDEINTLDKIIDKEIYELYQLTDEEIKIIEGG